MQHTLEDIIRRRRAVYPRQYNGRTIPVEAIGKILRAANWAPTHKKTEPWRFKVMRGEKLSEFGQFLADRYKATTKKFSERKYKKIADKFQRSSCVIAICMQRDPRERIPEWEEIASTAMAVQNMWLTASELEIGCYWSSTALRKEVDGFFNMMQDESCLGFFYMGYYDDELPEGVREPMALKTEWL